jgi:transcriptional regulator with XRE-family HTH domain
MQRPSNIHAAPEFGAQLRASRKDLNLSQEEVADVIGVNRRVLGQLENGKTTVQLQIALEAARAVGLDITLVPRR